MSASDTEKTFIEVEPFSGWQFISFKELWQHKELFYFFILKDIKIRYKQTILGNLWGIIQPFITMLILSVFFGIWARIPADGVPYPIFVFTGLVPWIYFSKALNNASGSLVNNSFLISKIYFPREIIPLTPVIACLWDFIFSFLVLLFLMVYFNVYPSVMIIITPVLILLMMLTASGIGLFLSALSAKYRDVEYAMGFLLQIWMFSSPIIYPMSMVPERYHLIYALNPLVGIIEGFRAVLLGTHPLNLDYVLISFIEGAILFIIGTLFFKRTEYYFADVL